MRLSRLTKIVLALQEHIEDSVLTSEEEEIVEEYHKDKKDGNLISSEDLKTELGL